MGAPSMFAACTCMPAAAVRFQQQGPSKVHQSCRPLRPVLPARQGAVDRSGVRTRACLHVYVRMRAHVCACTCACARVYARHVCTMCVCRLCVTERGQVWVREDSGLLWTATITRIACTSRVVQHWRAPKPYAGAH